MKYLEDLNLDLIILSWSNLFTDWCPWWWRLSLFTCIQTVIRMPTHVCLFSVWFHVAVRLHLPFSFFWLIVFKEGRKITNSLFYVYQPWTTTNKKSDILNVFANFLRNIPKMIEVISKDGLGCKQIESSKFLPSSGNYALWNVILQITYGYKLSCCLLIFHRQNLGFTIRKIRHCSWWECKSWNISKRIH